MKHLLLLVSFYLLFSPLFARSSKPPVFIIPPKIEGQLSDIQIKFLLITLNDSLSSYFDVSPPPQNKSGECLAGCNFFQMEIIEEDGVTQLILKWKSDEFTKIESNHCARCNTTELNEKVRVLVENLVSDKTFGGNFVEEKKFKGVLFLRLVKGEFRWYKDGDEDKDGKYEGVILNGLPSNEGILTWPDGEKYIGEWEDGRQNGQGKLTFFSGNKYEGEFKDGKYSGRGVFTWTDLDKYEGEFKDGKKHGHGIYIQNDGSKFVGEFKNGLKNGKGTLSHGKGELDGNLFVGEFKDGKKHGHGIYTQNDGSKFIGEFRNGLKNGKGTLTYGKGKFEGDVYEGNFKDEIKEGQGRYTYANGDIYSGEYKNDKKHGQGTFNWNNGDKYVGNFYNGNIRGEGTQIYFDGRKYAGEWLNGKFHGRGKFISPGGESYDGQWQSGKYNGQGTYIFGKGNWKGDKYEGEYKNGKREGQGTYTFSDGKKYSGSFKNGKLHGKGILTSAEGDKYEGKWNDGKYWDIIIYEKDGNITGEYANGVKLKWLDTLNRCQDLNTHTHCLSFKASAPPGSPQPWGKISKYSPEVFCASDLSAGICDKVTTSLLAATNEWGNFGPLEYWVLGTEEQAGKALTDVFCSRRKKRGHFEKARCLQEHKNGEYGFEYYRKAGAKAVASRKPKQDAARNGKRSWGIHFFTSSLPVGFTDLFKVPGVEEQRIIFHEYFHAFQHSHIQTRYKPEREELLKSVWFDEGSAEYMAWVGLLNSGLLEQVNMEGKNQFYPLENMRSKIEGGKIGLNSVCLGVSLKDIDYGNECTNVAYDLGTWAHAYLANKFGPNILLDIFYPNFEKLRWEGAYGMAFEDFYKEFNKFLNLTLKEHLSILPIPKVWF